MTIAFEAPNLQQVPGGGDGEEEVRSEEGERPEESGEARVD